MEIFMAQYIIRRGKFNDEVAKFDDTDTPLEVYQFYSRGCACPARTRSCKHTRILNKWRRAGRPEGMVYNDDGQAIGNIFNFNVSSTAKSSCRSFA